MLAGKLALVTGAGSGIGRATCQILAREGAKVIAADVNLKTAQETIKLIGGEHMSLALDVGDLSTIDAAFNQIKEKFTAPPTIVVNSAGITRDNFLLNLTPTQFQEVINVNLTGTYGVTRAACDALVSSGLQGSIVNIASIIGRIGNLGQANYAASKAAVEAFTRTTALEMGRYGIRCNAVLPGFIESPMTAPVPQKVKELFRSKVALGRLGQPSEVGEVIAFLASDRSSYVSGASFKVTGGL